MTSSTATSTEELRGLEADRVDALRRADPAALTGLLHPNAHFVHSSGFVEEAGQYVARLAAGVFAYTRIEIDEQTVTAAGGAAVITCRQRALMQVEGTEHAADARCSTVWTRDGDEWRLLLVQTTRLG